jgi:hypothetical protein
MKRSLQKLFASLIATCCVGEASAGPEAAPSIEFTCAHVGALPYDELFFRQGKQAEALILRAMRRSLPRKLTAGTTFDVMIPETQPDGSQGFKVIGSAALPPGAKQVMFLLAAKANPQPGKKPIYIMALDDSPQEFPIGSFRFANATRVPLHVKFGSTGQVIASGGIIVIKPSSAKEGFLPVIIAETTGKILFQTRFFWEPKVREFVMISPPSSPEAPLNLQFISEIVQPRPPTSTSSASLNPSSKAP